jgi:hypothetical protein
MARTVKSKFHVRSMFPHIVHDQLLRVVDTKGIIPLFALIGCGRKPCQDIFAIHLAEDKKTLDTRTHLLADSNQMNVVLKIKTTFNASPMWPLNLIPRHITPVVPTQIVDGESKGTGKQYLAHVNTVDSG